MYHNQCWLNASGIIQIVSDFPLLLPIHLFLCHLAENRNIHIHWWRCPRWVALDCHNTSSTDLRGLIHIQNSVIFHPVVLKCQLQESTGKTETMTCMKCSANISNVLFVFKCSLMALRQGLWWQPMEVSKQRSLYRPEPCVWHQQWLWRLMGWRNSGNL